MNSRMQSSASVLLQLLLEKLNSQIGYVIARNYAGYPSQLTGDIDLVVSPKDIELAGQIVLDVAKEHDWFCFYELHRPYVLYLGLCKQPDHVYDRSILVVELFAGGVWYATSYLPASQIIKDRGTLRGFYIPHPSSEATLTLFHHLLWNHRIPPKYRPRLTSLVEENPVEFQKLVSKAFGSRLAQFAYQSIVDHCWLELESSWLRFSTQLVFKNIFQSPYLFTRNWINSLKSLRSTEPGIVLSLVARDSQYNDLIVSRLESLADEWHIFLPSIRKSIRIESLQEYEQHKLDFFEVAEKAIRRGGVLIISFPDEGCQEDFIHVITEANVHKVNVVNDRFVIDEISVPWNDEVESCELVDSTALIWASVLTNHATRRTSNQKRLTV